MCRVLEVSTSGYYSWLKRDPSDRSVKDAELLERIRAYHERSGRTYGSPRIHRDLIEEDEESVGRKRVARLMRQEGLRGVCRRKFRKTTTRDRDARPAPDLVDRNFAASRPDQVWVADIT